MYELSFAFTTVLVTLLFLVFRISVHARHRAFTCREEALQVLYLINLLVISRMVFHPMATVNGRVQPLIFDAATVWPFRVNLIPFVNLLDYESKRDLLLNLIGNCALFIPTGILTPLLYKNLAGFKKTVLTGFLISLTIEIIQLPFAVRASDVDDLILNTAGVILGYGIYALAKCLADRKKVSK